MADTAYRTCPLCEATCGLELTLDGGEIVGVRGDDADVLSKGFLCPKGASFGYLDADPDRLRTPRVRRDGKLLPATWPEAFAAVHAGLSQVIEAHGRDAVALYLGNPNVHTISGGLYAGALRKALGSRNVYTASTLDQMPKHVSCGYLFGNPLAVPVPDIDRTDFLLILGADPYSSNGSLWTVPDVPGRLKALQARGGRFAVVDPRRSRTARVADRYVPIRPGTDVYLLLGMVHELFARDLVRPDRLADHVTGVEAVRELVAPFPPATVAPRCGIPADTIRELTGQLAAAPRAAVYGRIGTTTVEHGTVTSWLVDVLNVLTGNLDRPGGAMFPLPATSRRGTGSGGQRQPHHRRPADRPALGYRRAQRSTGLGDARTGRDRTMIGTALRTIAELPFTAATAYGDQPAHRARRGGEWVDTSFRELAGTVRALARGLVRAGIAPGDRVAVLAETRPEWSHAGLAVLAAGAVLVPIYPSSSMEECRWILSNSGARLVVCANAAQRDKVVPTAIVVIDDGGLAALASDASAADTEIERRLAGIDPDDPSIIIYTSGTTGPPKGCVLTHRNWLTLCAINEQLGNVVAGDVVYLFLPLAHVFAQITQYASLDAGATLVYFGGDVRAIVPELAQVRPTFLPSVPRIFEKLYTALQGAPPAAVRGVFGGRLRMALSGAAPISPAVLEFFHAAGVPVLEGYAMTESAGVGTVNTIEHHLKVKRTVVYANHAAALAALYYEEPDGRG